MYLHGEEARFAHVRDGVWDADMTGLQSGKRASVRSADLERYRFMCICRRWKSVVRSGCEVAIADSEGDDLVQRDCVVVASGCFCCWMVVGDLLGGSGWVCNWFN